MLSYLSSKSLDLLIIEDFMQFKQHNPIYSQVANTLAKALEKMGVTDKTQHLYKLLSKPPKSNMGDIAFACFNLAKELKKAPNKIASDIQRNLDQSDYFLEAKAFGPYLNFFLNPKVTNKIILNEILSEEAFSKPLVESSPKTIIEYSQPNTHKEMHVGHMRNLCLGNAIVKIYRYAGIETLSTTFPGDVGTHVAKCLWYYKKHNQQSPPTKRKGAWLGTLYTKGNLLLEEQKNTAQAEENKRELTQILKELHAQSGPYYELWKETRQWSVELMQEVYNWANVSFDSWYWESDVDASSVDLVKKYYEKGLFIKDDGAIGIDLSDEKLGFCLLLKSDGTGLYATKDLELARRKFQDQKVERSIYVVDNRQSLHFKQVFKTLEKMGFEHASDCIHLQYEMVELKDGAMSSRKGNIVPIQSLIDQMISHIKTNYLQKYEGQWEQSQIDETANIVASGAIKYGMTRVDSNKKIIFDMKDWLKLDGESGPYIQYVYARINSMLEKAQYKKQEASFEQLTHPLEQELINKLALFNTEIENSVSQNKTHNLCAYLYDLAKSFNSFYAECPVAKIEDQQLRQSRLALCDAVAKTIATGLSVLGIKAPSKM